MKKRTLFILAAAMVLMLSGCGNKQETTEESKESAAGGESAYAEAVDILNEVVKQYGEDELFAMYGGNQENAVMDAPGKFDVSKTEELKMTLGLPEEQAENIDDAASMVHMMNGNTFTGAVYHLKDGTDLTAFSDAVKENILATQWMCGQPDTLVIIDVDGQYVISAYGEAQIMEIFKNHALSALDGSQVITETPIA